MADFVKFNGYLRKTMKYIMFFALSKISTICSKSCDPINDKRGTIEFRSHVAGVLSKRAIILAHKRAGEKIEKITR